MTLRPRTKQRVPNWNGRPIIVIRQHPGSMGERPKIKRQRHNCTPSGSKGNRSNTSLITCINWKPFKNQALFFILYRKILCGLLRLKWQFQNFFWLVSSWFFNSRFTRVTKRLLCKISCQQIWLKIFTSPKKKQPDWSKCLQYVLPSP